VHSEIDNRPLNPGRNNSDEPVAFARWPWIAVVMAAALTAVAFEVSTGVIHNKGEVWVLRLSRLVFEVCLVTALGFALRGKEKHLRSTLLNKVSESEISEQQMRLQAAALEAAANAIVITDSSGTILWVNRAFTELTGYQPEEVIGQNPRILKSWNHDPSFYRTLWSTIQSGQVWRGEITNRKKDGFLYAEEMTITPVRSPSGEINYIAIKQDTTEKKRLEAQYRQAQKMEAVGRLAGGVAHDFNNILGVITGYSEISLERLEPEHQVARNIRKIKAAADRAVLLTRQLLAFSRQQIVYPRIIDLNAVVQGMADMLQRLVGDDVSLAVRPTIPLGGIKADVGQIEQVLMNLAVNARDAMPDGGPIIIETRNVDLDESYQRKHEPVRPGPYVMLSMSDSGCGMDDTTKASIFEPFFTTKEVGKGTGLGLATVYGIVKQSAGYIWVYSELGKGTTFKVFFPRLSAVAETPSQPEEKTKLSGGSETILLVEDDEGLREMMTTSLETAGYTVLEAGKPQAALGLVAKHQGPVHLLLSDIVLPQTSGVHLFKLLKVSAPDLKVIFISGYAADMLGRHDPLPAEAAFIEKPFGRDSLLSTVRTVLDEGAKS
jgi:two-component system, cell cycle sensor histidine kinase and response regulator CckA